MRFTARTVTSLIGVVVTSTALTACGSSSSDTPSTTSTSSSSTAAAGSSSAGSASTSAAGSETGSTGSTGGPIDLAAAGCPATIVVQTDWNPESEHGHIYEMFGDDPTIDATAKSVSGPLTIGGQPTGVNLEVRAGGPAIGFQTVSSQMYQDKDITMGYVATDEAIQLSDTTPTTAIFAPLDISPTMVMWDPETYPDVTSINDVSAALKANGGVWRFFDGSAYMEYLKSSGIADPSILDGSYDGTPANFVAAGGKDMQQGFASAEPYVYQNEVADWGKPVKYDLIASTGWDPYQSSMSIRAEDKDSLSGCLTALVPAMQQAEVDFYADPTKANALILKLVEAYDTGWTYTQGVADYSVKTQIELGLAGNGPNSTIGDFDDARMTKFLATATPIYTELGSPPKEGLTAADIYTNEFIDTAIGLP